MTVSRIATEATRSFLLTVHEPGSAVLEDLRTGQRVHVADLADLGSRVASWHAGSRNEGSYEEAPHASVPKVREPRSSSH